MKPNGWVLLLLVLFILLTGVLLQKNLSLNQEIDTLNALPHFTYISKHDTIYHKDTVYRVKLVYRVTPGGGLPGDSVLVNLAEPYMLKDSVDNEVAKTVYLIDGYGFVNSVELSTVPKGVKQIIDTIYVRTVEPSKPRPFEIGVNGGMLSDGRFIGSVDFTRERVGVFAGYVPKGKLVAVGVRVKIF